MVKYLGPKTHDQELLSVFPFEFPNNASQLFKEGSKAMWNISERRKRIASLKFGSVCGGSPEVAGMRSWPKRCANGRVYRVCHLSTSPAFLGCQLNRGNFANVNVLPGLAGTLHFSSIIFVIWLCPLHRVKSLPEVEQFETQLGAGRHQWMFPGEDLGQAGCFVWLGLVASQTDWAMLRKWIGRLRM